MLSFEYYVYLYHTNNISYQEIMTDQLQDAR